MNRYLIHFTYCGSSFHGVARIAPYYNFGDQSTVQGAFEWALKQLYPKFGECDIETASRTDAGVHALHSTLQIDFNGQKPITANVLTRELNKRFNYTNTIIRVLKTETFDASTFHVRDDVAQRSYLYRLAVARKLFDSVDAKTNDAFQPIEEMDRCYFIKNRNFNIEQMKQAAELFVGQHNFRTFMRPSLIERTEDASFAIRRIKSLTIEEGIPCCVTSERQAIAEDLYQYWNIRITARSFVYRQVRKIVGALLAVAQGQLTHKDIYEMLTIPSYAHWPFGIAFTAPARGLFLTGIEYEKPVVEETNCVDLEINEKQTLVQQ